MDSLINFEVEAVWTHSFGIGLKKGSQLRNQWDTFQKLITQLHHCSRWCWLQGGNPMHVVAAMVECVGLELAVFISCS